MILVNTDYISGKELQILGLVRGSTIQTKMDEARALANKRMIQQAESLGADAIVNVRYATSAIMAGAAEVMAYGTAVKFVND